MISQHIHNLFSAVITNILLHLQKLHHNNTRRRKIHRDITSHLTGLMDAAQWPQEMVVVKPSPPPSMEDMGMGMVVSSSSTTSSRPPSQLMERRARPQKEQALNCPRCNSTNTKFCYYNNYSLTQPRYFCKTCRRYWTEGGSLRNVPVGGGSRKNKRSSTTTPSTTNTDTNTHTSKLVSSDLIPQPTQNPKFHEAHDLNLTFSNYHSALGGNPNNLSTCTSSTSSTTVGVNPSALSAMEFLRSGVCSRGMMSPFMPLVQEGGGGGVYQTPPGFGLQEFRSSGVCFSVEGVGGYNDHQNNSGSGVQRQEQQEVQESGGGRMLFPFEDLRHVSSPNPTAADQFDQNRGQEGDSSVFWSGVMGGGAAW